LNIALSKSLISFIAKRGFHSKSQAVGRAPSYGGFSFWGVAMLAFFTQSQRRWAEHHATGG